MKCQRIINVFTINLIWNVTKFHGNPWISWHITKNQKCQLFLQLVRGVVHKLHCWWFDPWLLLAKSVLGQDPEPMCGGDLMYNWEWACFFFIFVVLKRCTHLCRDLNNIATILCSRFLFKDHFQVRRRAAHHWTHVPWEVAVHNPMNKEILKKCWYCIRENQISRTHPLGTMNASKNCNGCWYISVWTKVGDSPYDIAILAYLTVYDLNDIWTSTSLSVSPSVLMLSIWKVIGCGPRLSPWWNNITERGHL